MEVEKNSVYSGVVVNSQPSAASTYENQRQPTIVGTPVTVVPTVHSAVAYNPSPYVQRNTMYIDNQGTETSTQERPINRWADGICDWPRNLFPSCYCACCVCHGMYLVGQSEYYF